MKNGQEFDPERERQKMAEHYASLTDGELLKIALDMHELTDEAQQALREEASRRSLELADVQAPSPCQDVPEFDELVAVGQYASLGEADLAKGALESAGIGCWLADDNTIRMNWFYANALGGIKVCVHSKDAEAAAEVLEQPIPESFDVEGVGEFEQPRCPKCGSLEVLAEGRNDGSAYAIAWIMSLPLPLRHRAHKCGACGEEWVEESASK